MGLRAIINTKYPLIQGAMANISSGYFAASISNAGALGVIAAGGMTPDELRENIRTAKNLTSDPFAVNIMLLHPKADDAAQIVVEEGVKILTTGAGSPGKYMDLWISHGIKVLPVVPSVAYARRAEAQGASGVIAEGTESGGHVGELTTMALVPQVAATVKIPVIAAGGIASGRQLLAAFALGACGAQIGTALLVSDECPVHDNYKNAIINARDSDTVVTGRNGGIPVRVLRNQMSAQYIKFEKAGVSREELENLTLGSLRKAVIHGDTRDGSIMAGQVAGQLREIRPAAEIISEIFEDCVKLCSNLKIEA